MNSILPEPGQPSAQLSKLLRPTECRKTQHSTSQWHRTVHIPWLVDSYDTHKGKRWLNSNHKQQGEIPKPKGETMYDMVQDWCLGPYSCKICKWKLLFVLNTIEFDFVHKIMITALRFCWYSRGNLNFGMHSRDLGSSYSCLGI